MSEDERDSLEEIRLMLQALQLGQEQIERSIEAQRKLQEADVQRQRKTQEADVQRIEQRMSLLVTRREFEPIKNMAYGMIGLILIAFLTALASFVITVP